MPSLQTLGLFFIGLAVAVYALYRSLLPKPIAGIPHRPDSVRRILGDIPDILNYAKEHQEPFTWFVKQCVELKSPIVQIFVRIGGNPWVVVVDGREANDIMTRRSSEFDRSKHLADTFWGVSPKFQVALPTGPEWKQHRILMADTMSSGFIKKTNAPVLYAAFSAMLDLWRVKAKHAGERSMDVESDVINATLDAIWGAAFGNPAGIIKQQIQFLNSAPWSGSLPVDCDGVVHFPQAPVPEENDFANVLSDSQSIVHNSPFGKYHHKFNLTFFPKLRAAMQTKNRVLRRMVDDAEGRMMQVKDENSERVRSATDFLIAREIKAAAREGRKPQLHSRAIYDEIYGYFIGGHDTTASALLWGMVFLRRQQGEQKKLRSSLREVFPAAAAAGVDPNVTEIVNTSIPYLDGFIDEVLRLGSPTLATIRVTTRDTEIFGHYIPKGTDVWLMNLAPSITSRALPVDDSLRTKTSLDSRAKFGDWREEDISEFKPERWLKVNDQGQQVYDASAGPNPIFGAGLRSCFGKRLALMQLKIFFILTVWNFEVLPAEDPRSPLLATMKSLYKPRNAHVKLRQIVR